MDEDEILIIRIWGALTDTPQSVTEIASKLGIPHMHVRLNIGILEGQGRATRHISGKNNRSFTKRIPLSKPPREEYKGSTYAVRYTPRQEGYISFHRSSEE